MDFDLIHGIMKEPEIPSTARSSRALSNTGEK